MSSFYSLIIWVATLFACYEILKVFGLFEFNRSAKKVVTAVDTARKKAKKRKIELRKLGLYSGVTKAFHGLLLGTVEKREKYEFYIVRLNKFSEPLGRPYTPEEFVGFYGFVMLMSLLFIPLAVFNLIWLIFPIVGVVMLLFHPAYYEAKIRDEDEIIDNNFMDIYLLMYSQLKQGSRARLQGTLENYSATIEAKAQTTEGAVMLRFAKYFTNLLAMYEDHVAVPKLREVYHSAVIVNFCNVATQALNGVDNYDNLLTFKMSLVERKEKQMRINAKKLLAKGNRSIYAIWVILFIFIICGWWSKIPNIGG